MDRYFYTVVIICICFSFELAHAYPPPVDFSGQLTRWSVTAENPVITYAVETVDQQRSSSYVDLVDDAAKLWTDVPTSMIQLVRTDDQDGADISLSFRDPASAPSSSAGFTVVDEVTSDGSMAHCSIQVFLNQDLVAVAKTTLHELGHCLGLGHSLVPGSIMSYSLSENRFGLSVDDVAAVTHLYPLDGSDPSVPIRCGTSGSKGHRALGFVIYLLPIMVVLASRPKIRKKRAA